MALSKETSKDIFEKLKTGIEKCCPPMIVKSDKAGVYEIIGNKPVPYGYTNKIVPGMYFASTVIKKNFVSFYFFPCYNHSDKFENVAPKLLKQLKGKTCFNFTKTDQVDEKELNALLKKGIVAWKKAGYMK